MEGNNNKWMVYLLDKTKVDKLGLKGKQRRTMEHSEIIKLKSAGPIEVEAPSNYKARKEGFAILQRQSWWPQSILFIHVYPYLYAKNKVDDRFHQQPDLVLIFKEAKKHGAEVLA